MKQRRNVWTLSKWKWAGVVFLVAAAAGGAIYSMNGRKASTATGATVSPAAEGAAVNAPVASMQPAATAQPGATQAAAIQTAATPPATIQAGAAQQAGSTYFIDPDTKQARTPSPEEIAELNAAKAAPAAANRRAAAPTAAEPEAILGVNGEPGLRLTDEQMTYTIATKNADGKVSVEHANGKTEALKKVRAASAGGTKVEKEGNDVR